MKLSRREIMLGCMTLSAIMIGLTVWLGGPGVTRWQKLSDDKNNLRDQIEQKNSIISRKEISDAQLAELRQKIPQFESKRQTTPELLKEIQATADKHGLKFPRIQPGKEKQFGDLYALQINCSWEGSLEALTHVLFDLQSAGSRYDITELHATPLSANKLKGTIEIACAYYRNNSVNQTDLENKVSQ